MENILEKYFDRQIFKSLTLNPRLDLFSSNCFHIPSKLFSEFRLKNVFMLTKNKNTLPMFETHLFFLGSACLLTDHAS